MEHDRKTLAEFSKTYLKAITSPSRVEVVIDDHAGEDGFAAHVLQAMTLANSGRPQESRIDLPEIG